MPYPMIQKNMFHSSQCCTICGLLVATHRGEKQCFHRPHRKGCCHINRPLGHTHIQKPGVAVLALIHLVSADYLSFFGEFSFSWAGLFFVLNVSSSLSPSGVPLVTGRLICKSRQFTLSSIKYNSSKNYELL